jgi:hypothetical protein
MERKAPAPRLQERQHTLNDVCTAPRPWEGGYLRVVGKSVIVSVGLGNPDARDSTRRLAPIGAVEA